MTENRGQKTEIGKILSHYAGGNMPNPPNCNSKQPNLLPKLSASKACLELLTGRCRGRDS